MIRHIVMWKLKADNAANQKVAADAMADSNWDVILVSDHTSPEALLTYGTHPLHLEAGAVVKAHTRERACIDFELS